MKNNLKQYRCTAGYSQEEAAHAIGMAGSNRLSDWEQGKSSPNIINLFKLSVLYGIKPEKLYSNDFILAKSKIPKKPRKFRPEDNFTPIEIPSVIVKPTEQELISQLAEILVEGFLEIYSKEDQGKG